MSEESAAAAERARLVRKFARLRAQATLQHGGLLALSEMERTARQRITWLREEAKRQQQSTKGRGGFDGTAHSAATQQAPGVEQAQQARVDRLAVAADLIEQTMLPEIAAQLQAAQTSWTAANRTAGALADHLRSELEQWGISDAL